MWRQIMMISEHTDHQGKEKGKEKGKDKGKRAARKISEAEIINETPVSGG